MENNDTLKRILLNMNYDSKKTLSENVEKIMLNEAKVDKNYIINRRTNPNATAAAKFTIPKDSNIVKRGNSIEIGKANTFVFFTYGCDDRNFRYEGSLTGSADAKYENDELAKILDNQYCREKTQEEKNDDIFWKKGETPYYYWKILYDTLRNNKFDFKLLDINKKETTDPKNAYQMWWKNFIINRNLGKYAFITVGSPATVYGAITSNGNRYRGEADLSRVILTLKGYEGSKTMSLKEFLERDWKTTSKEDGKVIDYTKKRKTSEYTPGGGGTGWNTTCKGTYSMGCKTTEVGQAQQCLKDAGLYPYTVDSKFGKKTMEAVKAKIGKTSFTDADLQTICKTKQGSGGEDLSDFDKDMSGSQTEKPKEDATWTGDVY